MADIFINYRHEDGATAHLLNAELDKEYNLDAFIDTDMEGGARISETIPEALHEARVFLAIIGKEWMKRRNLRRLTDPNDWIRREYLAALARKEVLIIPLLVHDKVQIEDVKRELPPALSAFGDLVARRLSLNNWQKNVGNLVDEIKPHLARPPRSRESKAAMTRDLPYLCDRAEQEYGLTQLTVDIARTHSLVCVLHGHKWEAHSKFLTRLQQLGMLDRLLDAGAAGVGRGRLQWDAALARAGKFAELIRFAIKNRVMQKPEATDPQLCEFLKCRAQPMVLTLQLTGYDLEDCGACSLGALTQAWNALIADLGAPPISSLVFWINVAYEEMPAGVAWQDLPALEPLTPVTDGHIQTWLDLPEVQTYVEGRTTDILNLTGDSRLFIKRGQIHMQTFADEVNALIHR
jgi:TIR domain